MSKRSLYPPRVHYLVREPGHLGRTACNAAVSGPAQYSDQVAKVSCYDCARKAPNLTIPQRVEIWQQADERLEKYTRCPWATSESERARQNMPKDEGTEKPPF